MAQLNTILSMGLATTPTFARLTRGGTLGECEKENVVAAYALGARTPRIILRHVLPNIAAPLVVLGSLTIGNAVPVEASLSFLGLGPPLPIAFVGLVVNDGMVVLRRAP